MIHKNATYPYITIFIRLWFDLAALIQFLFAGKFKDAQAVSKAHIYFFKNFNNTKKKRYAIKTPYKVNNIYKGVIIWDYFLRGKKKFSDLNPDKFD